MLLSVDLGYVKAAQTEIVADEIWALQKMIGAMQRKLMAMDSY